MDSRHIKSIDSMELLSSLSPEAFKQINGMALKGTATEKQLDSMSRR